MISQEDKHADNGSIPSLAESSDDMSQNASQSFSVYKYRDFSDADETELEREKRDSDSPSPAPPPSKSKEQVSIRLQKFPVKLYAILARKEFSEIITWMPHGRSWKVLKPKLFETMVMPLFFEYNNYHSFNRLINAWSFRRITSGPDSGSYYHELFLRGKPELQKYMRRLPKTHKKLPARKEDEPDFYEMDKKKPLPPLEEQRTPPRHTTSTMASPINPSTRQQSQQLPPLKHSTIGLSGISAFNSFSPSLGAMVQQRFLPSMGFNGHSLGALRGFNMPGTSSLQGICSMTNFRQLGSSYLGSIGGVSRGFMIDPLLQMQQLHTLARPAAVGSFSGLDATSSASFGTNLIARR